MSPGSENLAATISDLLSKKSLAIDCRTEQKSSPSKAAGGFRGPISGETVCRSQEESQYGNRADSQWNASRSARRRIDAVDLGSAPRTWIEGNTVRLRR